MAVSVKDNSIRLVNEHRNKASLAIRFMLEAAHRQSTPKTPMSADPKTRGHLRADVTKRVNGTKGVIHWGKHYALYQERGYTSGKVRRYTTPGTGAHFAKNAIDDVKRNHRRYFRMAGL